jgi:hypothetical protein
VEIGISSPLILASWEVVAAARNNLVSI